MVPCTVWLICYSESDLLESACIPLLSVSLIIELVLNTCMYALLGCVQLFMWITKLEMFVI